MAKANPIPPFPADTDRTAFGHWLSGFADGESTFQLRVIHNRPNPSKPRGSVGYQSCFRIVLRDDDSHIIRLIHSYWQCGLISWSDNRRSKIANAKPVVIFNVTNTPALVATVIPFFDSFPLRSKKANDYRIWREGTLLLSEVSSRPFVAIRSGRRLAGQAPKWTADEAARFIHLHHSLRDIRYYKDVTLHPSV